MTATRICASVAAGMALTLALTLSGAPYGIVAGLTWSLLVVAVTAGMVR